MDDDKIVLTVSTKEFELVLNALAQLPYAQVAPLLNGLVAQATARQAQANDRQDVPEEYPPVS